MINGSKYEFKSYVNTTIDGIPYKLKQQNRAYLESVEDVNQLNYIFEAGKITEPTDVIINGVEHSLSAEQLVRQRFLEMYQKPDNAEYFLNENTFSFWKSIHTELDSYDDFESLANFINNSDYNSSWLNFIKIE